jgi:hypothetical protein
MKVTLRPSTVCFHYGPDGRRCRALCLEPSWFSCATHLHQYQHTPAAQLFEAAARAIVDSTRYTEQGLPFLACRNLGSWKQLCNVLQALSVQGYHDHAELLTLLVSSIESIRAPSRGTAGGALRKGKPFERLVTRLYLEELAQSVGELSRPIGGPPAASTRVLWDQRLPSLPGGRRQIDVLLRSRQGETESLTIVECRDHEVEVSEMDAFVTLVRHVGASHGVMASSVGFQRGAIDCARLEGVEVRVITEDDFSPSTTERMVDVWALEPIGNRLDSAVDGRPVSRHRELEHNISVIERGLITRSLADLIHEMVETHAPELGSMPPRTTLATPGMRLLFPDGRSVEIGGVRVAFKIVERRKRCVLLLPTRAMSFLVDTPLAATSRRIGVSHVPLFAPRAMNARRFYVNMRGQAYYCSAVDLATESATIVLLEDLQHDSRPLTVVGTQALSEAAQHLYAVEDVKATQQLSSTLAHVREFASPLGDEDSGG